MNKLFIHLLLLLIVAITTMALAPTLNEAETMARRADLERNGVIDSHDYFQWAANWITTDSEPLDHVPDNSSDLNQDGLNDETDLFIFASLYHQRVQP